MLVLSRKINERIIIGKNIELEILGIRGGVVRLGIKAPREVSVVREELHEQLVQENRECANTSPIARVARLEVSDQCVV